MSQLLPGAIFFAKASSKLQWGTLSEWKRGRRLEVPSYAAIVKSKAGSQQQKQRRRPEKIIHLSVPLSHKTACAAVLRAAPVGEETFQQWWKP